MVVPQAGVVAVRAGQVLLVTSRGGKRWVIPKGGLEGSPPETAAREAWEEAGVRGRLSPEPLGRFRYAKRGGTYEVEVYLLEVEEVMPEWPERRERRREWVTPEEAARRVAEPGLRALLRGL